MPAKRLCLSWGTSSYASEYDLEYCFIDEKSADGIMLAANLSSLTNPMLEALFVNNSTRVTIKGDPLSPSTHYNVNMVYDPGFFLYRIRPVENIIPDPSDPDYIIRDEHAWKYSKTGTTVTWYVKSVLDVTGSTFFPHEACINWQYNASFAEDAKRKEILTYFDGKLQNRQTVTINNVDEIAVVQETILDEFGRAAASILPAPVKDLPASATLGGKNNQFQYFRYFNVNLGGNPYSYKDILYDNKCSLVADPLASNELAGRWAGGAAGYYSPNNWFKDQPATGPKKYPENDFVPDADRDAPMQGKTMR
jgi:hypothetical protein